MSDYILILYYSHEGHCEKMAQDIAIGVEQQGLEARLRTVPEVSPNTEISASLIPEQGALYCSQEDLSQCSGLIVGSPSYFGQMAAPLKYFFDQTSKAWLTGELIDKPAAVFTSSSSLHGGQEATLLGLGVPLLHHGMLLCGIEQSQDGMLNSQSGGTPYGASHWQGVDQERRIDDNERLLCKRLGMRVARFAQKLK